MSSKINNSSKSDPLGIVYYTPINKPKALENFLITNKKDFELIKDFIVKNTKRRKNPYLESFKSSGLSGINVIDRIKNSYPTINKNDIEDLFEILSQSLYTSAKSVEKYFAFIANADFIFIYHFKPEKSITFKGNEIEEFIKYLDSSTINWFLFLTNKKILQYYYDISTKEVIFSENETILYCYEKETTKGFKHLISKEPIYDIKGQVKIRCELDSNTDIVIETYHDHIENLSKSMLIDFENSIVNINGLKLKIKEVQINDKKYDSISNTAILNHIAYCMYDIEEFIINFDYYYKKIKPNSIIEEKESIIFKIDNEIIKRISKPNKSFNNINTIYLLGKSNKNLADEALLEELKTNYKVQIKLSIFEISRFDDKYQVININDFILFVKIKKSNEAFKLAKLVSNLTKNIEGQYNQFYKKLLSLIGLMVISNYIYTNKIAKEIYQSSKLAISSLITELSKQKHSMSLEEIDNLGIEFKAGKLADKEGFFDASPEKFTNKLLEKLKAKNQDFLIYLIGINEDTKDFSPIPLHQIRNEYRNSVKEKLEKNGFKIDLIDSLPINEKQGLLLIILRR